MARDTTHASRNSRWIDLHRPIYANGFYT